jgi:hypothetical protein
MFVSEASLNRNITGDAEDIKGQAVARGAAEIE